MASGSGGFEDLDIGGSKVKAVYFRSPKEPFGYLSLWYPSKFVIGGIQFTSAYQYIMYRKCMLFGDSKAAEEVLKTDSPQMQQTIAGAAKGFQSGRMEWHASAGLYYGAPGKIHAERIS